MLVNCYTVELVNGTTKNIATPFDLGTVIMRNKGVIKNVETGTDFIVLDKIVQYKFHETKEVEEVNAD